MSGETIYRDPTDNNFPNDYDPSKVDSRIKLRTNAIRTKMYGKDVRSAVAEAAELSGVVSKEAQDASKLAQKAGAEATTAADDIGQRFDEQIAGSTNDNEVIDYRRSSMLSKSFETARQRGDFVDQELRKHGLNIEWFGAVGDGITDSTKSMADAIAFAQENNLDCIFIPDGNFVLSPAIPYLVTNLTVTGKSKYTSKITTTTTVFDVATYGVVENMTIEKTINDSKQIINLGGKAGPSLYGMRLRHLHLGGSQVSSADVGSCKTVAIKLDLAGMGLWDTSVSDVQATYVYSGLQIDSTSGGWITGCDFNGLTKQFSHSAFEMISSTNDMQDGVYTMSRFTWMAEVSGSAPDAVGFIVSGNNNEFDNLRLFQDGVYSGHAIELTSQSDKTGPSASFGSGHTNFNRFTGGHLEGDIFDPEGLFPMQYWHDVMVIGYYANKDDGTDDMSTGHPMMVQTKRVPNLISEQVMGNLFDWTLLPYMYTGVTYSSGVDSHGKFLEVNATVQAPIFLQLPHQQELLAAIKNGPFALGAKVQDIGGTIAKITSSPVRGYLQFNGQQVPRKLDSQSYSTPQASDPKYKELIWNYSSNPDWFTDAISQNYGAAYYELLVDAGSHVRIYGLEITKGCLADLSVVSPNGSFFLPIKSGGRNYLQNAEITYTGTNQTSLAAGGKSCQVDVAGLNYQKSKYLTISADVDVNNYKASGTKRLFMYAEVILTFEDNTSLAVNAGVTNVDHDLVRGRIFAYRLLPEKRIVSATANIGITGGGSCDYYAITMPQLETGTVASDYHTSV